VHRELVGQPRRFQRTAGSAVCTLKREALGTQTRKNHTNSHMQRTDTMRESRNDSDFAIRIASMNAAGYFWTVIAITYVDARLKSHVLYGARSYRYGYVSSLLAIPTFIITLHLLRRATTRGRKCLASCLAILAAMLSSLWVFAPEVPHSGLVVWCLMYSIVSLAATWLRYSGPDLSFVQNQEIPLQARLEGLKSILSMWQAIALATSAGFLAGLVPWAVAIQATNSHVVVDQSDLFLLNSAGLMQVILVSVAILLGPIREVVSRVLVIGAEFGAIRERPIAVADGVTTEEHRYSQ
jgi:hypothetical protein